MLTPICTVCHVKQTTAFGMDSFQRTRLQRCARREMSTAMPQGVHIHVATGDHASVRYRVPKEWAGLTEEQRGEGSLVAFKRSRWTFMWEYGEFVRGPGVWGLWGGGLV